VGVEIRGERKWVRRLEKRKKRRKRCDEEHCPTSEGVADWWERAGERKTKKGTTRCSVPH